MPNWDAQEADIERAIWADPQLRSLWLAVDAARDHTSRGRAKSAFVAAARAKGLLPEGFSPDLGTPNSGVSGDLEIDHQNFGERHAQALTVAAGAAPLGVLAAPALFGGGAAAGANPGAYTAPSLAAGGGAAGWLPSLLKAGAATAIPAMAKQVSGGPGSVGAGPAGAAVDQLIPELVKRFQMQNARTEQAGPLYDAVLKMATGRLPIWAKPGGA